MAIRSVFLTQEEENALTALCQKWDMEVPFVLCKALRICHALEALDVDLKSLLPPLPAKYQDLDP